MTRRWQVRRNAYHDSIKLMRVSEALAGRPGVIRAAAVMATPLNLDLLAGDGLLPPEVQASPDDLVIAVLAEDDAAAEAALAALDEVLAPRREPAGPAPGSAAGLHILEQAARVEERNLAVIAVPGPYAATEAFAALRAGLHVFLFSDNVPLQQEVRLKRLAAERDLLMMGPDCGTAIIGGIGLGFANRVQPGPVGIVGASGTGIQQVCCLLDSAGVGVAQAIGTGGRDLSAAVGGSMTRRALWALEADDRVQVIAVISKPADGTVARRLHQEMLGLRKPAVVCLPSGVSGSLGDSSDDAGPVRYAANLTEAAGMILQQLGHRDGTGWLSDQRRRGAGGSRVYGLFAGGTLCSEAAQVLDSMGAAHDLIDLGADEYTLGRAHPIIDPRLRASMLADLSGKEDVGAILFDVILGDLAHPDPVAPLIDALERWPSPPAGERVPVVAVLVGARADPQGLERQRRALEAAGIQVFASNAAAAGVAGQSVAGTP